MNVYLNLSNPAPFKRHLLLEGDTIVDSVSDAELVLSDQSLLSDVDAANYVVGGDFHIAAFALETMGYKTSSRLSYDFVLTKFFDGREWLEQLLLGFELPTLMNDNLGFVCKSGYAARYCDKSELQKLFHNLELRDFLVNVAYVGFVSMLLSFDLSTCSVVAGIPAAGLFNVLEGCPRKMSDFFTQPHDNTLMESWTVNLLLSRYPYPFHAESSRVSVPAVAFGVDKHFWFNDLRGHSKALYTDSCTIGYATSWGHTLGEANSRVLRTCRGLDVALKQFRTDLSYAVSRQESHLIALGLVEPQAYTPFVDQRHDSNVDILSTQASVPAPETQEAERHAADDDKVDIL